MTAKISKYLFYLFIILLPWQTRWIFYEAGGEYGRLSVYASWLTLILSVLFFWLAARPKIQWTRDWLLYIAVIFALINCFVSGIPTVSLYYFGLILSAVLFAYLWRQFPKIWSWRIFLGSGLIQSLVAISQFWSQKVPANKWLGLAEHLPQVLGDSVVALSEQRILRAYGALTHPNVLGGFLLITIFAGLYLWIYFYRPKGDHPALGSEARARGVGGKKLYLELVFIILTLLISTYALLASFSRSAVLALVISLFCAVIINILKRDWLIFKVILKYIIIFIIVFFSFNLLYPGAWAARLTASDRLEVKSTTERLGTFQQLSWDNPKDILIGQGLGQNTYATDSSQPIHNIFILYLAETGIVGLIILVFVLRRIFRSSIKADILSTSLLLGLVIVGMVDHYLWTAWTGLCLTALGLVSLHKD